MSFARLTLTTRLTVLFTLVTATVLLGLGLLVAWVTAQHFVELDRLYLGNKLRLVQKVVSEAGEGDALRDALDDMLDNHDGLYLQVWLDGQLVYGPDDLTVMAPESPLAPGDLVEWTYGGRALRGFAEVSALAVSEVARPPALRSAQVVIAVDTQAHAHFLASMRQTLALYLLLAALLSGVLGWWVARRGLAPLKAMRDRATSTTVHTLQQRMPVDSVPVEFAELAASLNAMFERLHRDFQRLMDFSADLAHELRTPVSNLLTQTQVALAQRRSADEYRDVLESNAEEFQRLARMVADMLLLAKTENGIDLPHREAIELAQEVQALFDFYEAVAEERGVRLRLEGEAHLQGDRLMVRRAIGNLLSNALRYAETGSVVLVCLSDADHVAKLDVINQGATIDPVHLPRLFDRFYRADPARAHPGSDGAGLGLAITKAIVESHGGTIAVRSSHGRTCFTMVFPDKQRR